MVVVIERDGQIVAMSENELYMIDAEDEDGPDFMLPGRYGHINNMGVRQDLRGQGFGRLLVQATFDAFAHMHLDGYILWFNPANPLSSPFWPRMGFQPLWRTYQRHYPERSEG
nr:GNAT family N-acetyltransferase [Dictyobacter kobayashii]